MEADEVNAASAHHKGYTEERKSESQQQIGSHLKPNQDYQDMDIEHSQYTEKNVLSNQ